MASKKDVQGPEKEAWDLLWFRTPTWEWAEWFKQMRKAHRKSNRPVLARGARATRNALVRRLRGFK